MKQPAFLHSFAYGLILSIPLTLTFISGFSSSENSNGENNSFLLTTLVIGFLSLPGSLILFLIGFTAAFSGKTGGMITVACIALSIPNAHIMGMLYAHMYKKIKQKTKNQNNILLRDCPKCSSPINTHACICKHCHSAVEPLYVNNPTANRQVIKILKLQSLGFHDNEIAKKLNDDGDFFSRITRIGTRKK